MSGSRRRGPGRPRRISEEEQRVLVLDAALHVFARVGVSGATIELIAREAGVNRQAVYEQFDDKNALFAAVLQKVASELGRELGPAADRGSEVDDVTWFRDNFRRTIAYFGRNPDALALLKQTDHAPDLAAFRGLSDLGGSYAKVLRRRWAERDIDLGPMPDVFPMLAFAMLSALAWVPWEDESPDSATLIDLLAVLCAGGMTALSPKVVARLDGAPRARPPDPS